MRQGGLVFAFLAAIFLHGFPLHAETSLDALEKELDDIKTQHEQAGSQAMSNFFSQLDAASRSPDEALNLYQQAGGLMPDKTAVVKPRTTTKDRMPRPLDFRRTRITSPISPICSSSIVR